LSGSSNRLIEICRYCGDGKYNEREWAVVPEDIMDSSAHLIANRNSYYAKKREIISLYEELNRVVKNG